jgi:predicted RNA-binding Zn-ribbon protein involved in translation (DUF1610 family)
MNLPTPPTQKKARVETPAQLNQITCPQCGETRIVAMITIRYEHRVLGVKDKIAYLEQEVIEEDTLKTSLHCEDCGEIWSPGYLDYEH